MAGHEHFNATLGPAGRTGARSGDASGIVVAGNHQRFDACQRRELGQVASVDQRPNRGMAPCKRKRGFNALGYAQAGGDGFVRPKPDHAVAQLMPTENPSCAAAQRGRLRAV